LVLAGEVFLDNIEAWPWLCVALSACIFIALVMWPNGAWLTCFAWTVLAAGICSGCRRFSRAGLWSVYISSGALQTTEPIVTHARCLLGAGGAHMNEYLRCCSDPARWTTRSHFLAAAA
jgi:membrane protease YdiL (CAAX protease family)